MRARTLIPLSLAAVLGSACADPAADVTSELSPSEAAGLRFTREEEKLARDVYGVMVASGPIFDNIGASEQKHFDAVGGLLVTYELDDPSAGLGPGVFQDPVLATLYAELVARGQPGGVAALQVGCAIEELDIRDLELALTEVTHADIAEVYESLVLGSRNHLRAFYSNVTAAGATYVPVYLDQATFDAIVTSPKEQGRP